MHTAAKLGLCAFGLLVFGASCQKDNEFPVEPVIEFVSLERFGTDSAYVTISFTDGDGDIGFREGEDQPPYDFQEHPVNQFASLNKFHWNLILRQWEMVDGEWSELALDFSPAFWYRIGDLTSEGQDKALEGEIRVTVGKLTGFLPNTQTPGQDSVKYRIELIDRALNVSNWVETPLITD